MTTKQDLRHAADRLIELHEAGDLDAVLALADEVVTEATALGEQDEIARESLFVARFQRAIALTERDELAAAAEAYGEAADTPTDLDDPDQRHEVAMALLQRGMCLDVVGDASAAVDTYDEVERRFGGADDPVTRDQVLRARVNRAASLLGAGDAEAAAASADVLLASIEPCAPLDAEQWVLASRVRAAALVELGRTDEARRVLEAAAEVEVDDDPVVEQQRLVAEDLEALEGS
jgi:tetratricopeptide (TPR) repeat protein